MNPGRYLPRALPPALDALATLALDLRWSWNHEADHLWHAVDPALWASTGNPWVILESVSAARLEALANDVTFTAELAALARRRDEDLAKPTWFQRAAGGDGLGTVAYFSMEFGLSEALPLYSGGLGVLAGDHLKTASDLGVPVVGVGLLYQLGYFRQALDARGEQIAFFPYNAPSMLPVTPVRGVDGEWTDVTVDLPGRTVHLRAWEVQVGRCRLLLLDSNAPLNSPGDRGITAELYGGGPEMRLQQEIVLGIGGWRLLEKLGVDVDVCHMNEGHAAFALLARARGFQRRVGCAFSTALWCTRAGNMFTTHTSVESGFDRFAPDLVREYLASTARELGISIEDLLAMGRADPADGAEPFTMAYLAVRGCAGVNGVSAVHETVSRRIFQPLFPRWPRDEVPVSYVTNGVHVPSWDSQAADQLWTQACGKDRWHVPTEDHHEQIRSCSDAELWRMRGASRRALVGWVRGRVAQQRASHGGGQGDVGGAELVMEPDTLTIGFARRFAAYKRPALLLRDPDRLTRLLTGRDRPVQLVLAGKAHPDDREGRRLIRVWAEYVRRPEVRDRVVFIEDYDLAVAAQLVQGADLWLNTPRRPWEASGTSGMKVLVNGGLNVSQLDGWWAEGYSEQVGWAIGDGREHADTEASDARDAEQLYDLLERHIVPCFYQRDAQGIPTSWMARVRESMAALTPAFSTNRMLREYTESHYVPRSRAYRAREADGGKLARELEAWHQTLERHWAAVRCGALSVRTEQGQHRFSVEIYIDDVPADAVVVELYADARGGEPAVRLPMTRTSLVGTTSGFRCEASVADDRPSADFTPRVVPVHAAAVVPLEARQIAWAR